jgi:hypothetical protein
MVYLISRPHTHFLTVSILCPFLYCYVLTYRNTVLLCSYLQEHSTVMFLYTGAVLLCSYLQEHKGAFPVCTTIDASLIVTMRIANTWPTARYVFRASDPEKNFAFLVSSFTGALLCTNYVWRVVWIFMGQLPNADKILTYSIIVCVCVCVCVCICVWELSQNFYMLIMIIFPSYLTPYSFCISLCVIFCLKTLSAYNIIYRRR